MNNMIKFLLCLLFTRFFSVCAGAWAFVRASQFLKLRSNITHSQAAEGDEGEREK